MKLDKGNKKNLKIYSCLQITLVVLVIQKCLYVLF